MTIKELEHKAKELRQDLIRSIYAAGSGHTGASLGLADVFTALYFNILNHRANDPQWENRDRLVLSIGHVAPVHYTSLAHAGYFPKEELLSLRKLGSRLQGHPGRNHGLPGLELSSGSLGQGLSVAVGMALAAKHNKKTWRVYSIHGDGELQEGSIWEAAMSAGHYKLDNLIALVDRNKVQIDGSTEKVMKLEPLKEKWESFDWHVLECNGNQIKSIIQAYNKAKIIKGKPTLIIAKTKMGAGITEIEGDYTWHGKAPNDEDMKRWISKGFV